MLDLHRITEELRDCPCGREHAINIRSVEIAEGILPETGRILREAGFPSGLHLVADKNTLAAAAGLRDILSAAGFRLSFTLYDNLRTADTAGVARVTEDVKHECAGAVISVGTGSLNDICRFTCAQLSLPFAIFATAPSMDGFASVMAPITENGFKRTFPAKAPEVIIADTAVLAKSPAELKAAGLGDLLGKYTAHADWEISALTTGEYYCDAIASLTRAAVDRAVELTRASDTASPEYAGSLMEALVLSGLAMLLSGCTRPASGSEHHTAHFWEMQYALRGLPEVYHGKKVGIATSLVADVYAELAALTSVRERRRPLDEETLARVYGPLWPEARRESDPNPLDKISDGCIENNWDRIRASLARVPSGAEIRALIRRAGGEATCSEAGIPAELAHAGIRYGRYARFRITMMRILGMLDFEPDYESLTY